MKENKLTPQQTFLRISVVLLITLWAIIFISSCDNKNNSHIEKVIKKHNSIKDSWTNVKHPTVPKPASSQSTVIYGDSVRVIPKNSTIVKVQTPLNADIPCQNLDVLNTVEIFYTGKYKITLYISIPKKIPLMMKSKDGIILEV